MKTEELPEDIPEDILDNAGDDIPKQHVMISYNWADQRIMLKVTMHLLCFIKQVYKMIEL